MRTPLRHIAGSRPRIARTISLVAMGALLFTGTAAALVYDRIMGNIDVRDVDSIIVAPRPTKSDSSPSDNFSGDPINILIIGSDSRQGENGEIVTDRVDGMRSDTQIIMHISRDRQRVEMISIPRDSWVSIPACPLPGERMTRAQSSKFNAAFALGGQTGDVGYAAACTITTIEELTNVYIDGFVVIDFTGFEKMIDALQGVPYCIPRDIVSKKAHLNIAAGKHVLDGETALKYARARTGKGLGDGSDIGRIGRQQELLGAIVNHAMSKNLLTNTPQLIQFLEAFTSSLTTSPNMASITNLTGLAWSLRNINTSKIEFITVPHGARPNDPANVVWSKDAERVWEALINDTPVNPSQPELPSTQPTLPGSEVSPTPKPSPTIDSIRPDDVTSVC